MTDAEIIEWLNFWLVGFTWSSDTRLCTLTFKDPGEHRYSATGKDLRECIANAVARHPTSLTWFRKDGEYTK